MAKLTRVLQRVFGSGAGIDQIAQFGSLAAGSPAFTTDPATAQALSNWLTGWFAAVIGGNAPAIEDMNAAMFVMTYQLAYIFQAGVSEWNTSTVYYIGSLVNDGNGILFKSLTDANQGNALTDLTKWRRASGSNLPVSPTSANYTLTPNDGFIPCNAGAGAFTLTLPATSSVPGASYYIKKLDSTANAITVVVTGGDVIDGASSFTMDIPNESVTLISDGAGNWSIF